jgi:hypothetical protein
MRFQRLALGLLLAGAAAAGGLAVASPAWAADEAAPACRLSADVPTQHGNRLDGKGKRKGCSDTVTYFWVRIYKVVDLLPDSEIAVKGRQYVRDDELTAGGNCDGADTYYTHTSTATGLSGDSRESTRAQRC